MHPLWCILPRDVRTESLFDPTFGCVPSNHYKLLAGEQKASEPLRRAVSRYVSGRALGTSVGPKRTEPKKNRTRLLAGPLGGEPGWAGS